MRKILTLISLGLTLLSVAYGQCVPNMAYTSPGIYPDSASGFPPAVATYEYNLVITAVIPFDTIIWPFPRLPIDSIGVTEVIGLPEGFIATPNSPSGYWPGGSSGCMLISGTAGSHQTGVYPLVFKARGYMINIPYDYEITFYSLTVLDSTAYGIGEINAVLQSSLKAYPNPFTEYIHLELYTSMPGDYGCVVYDHTGRQQYVDHYRLHTGLNTVRLNGATLSPGVYYCVVRHSETGAGAAVRLLKH